MAENATIARPYAEAAFALADAAGTLAKWSASMQRMAAVADDDDMLEAIGNPRFSAEQLYGLFASAAGESLFLEAQNFVRVLIENRRLALLPDIRENFEELKNEREGTVEADIASAFPLEGEALAGLIADLERRFKRKIEPRVAVDPELIGGVRVQVGDEVIDGSVRGRLAAMAGALRS